MEKPFFMQANPVFIKEPFFVCAVSKQILFFSTQILVFYLRLLYDIAYKYLLLTY